MIRSITFDKDKFPNYEVNFLGEKKHTLPQLSKVNILVGPNNSGKSRFLRQLLRDSDYKVMPGYEGRKLSEYPEAPEILDSAIGSLPHKGWDRDPLLFDLITNQYSVPLSDPNYSPTLFRTLHLACDYVLKSPHWAAFRSRWNEMKFRATLESSMAPFRVNGEPENITPHWHKLYVPMLRTIRKAGRKGESWNPDITSVSKELYEFPNEVTIFTGETIYDDVQRLLLGRRSDREMIRRFEEFLRVSFFPHEPSLELISRLENKNDPQAHRTLYVQIGKAQARPIHDLGDGIQAIIIATFPLFTRSQKNDNWLVGIEEPEVNLHPGFQRLLIEALLREPDFKGVQFFITTHSNHLLDLAQDYEGISIYSFAPEQEEIEGTNQSHKFAITPSVSGERGLLEALGVRNSSVFLSNCTIWVEGICDRRIYQRYLEVYQEHLLEQYEQRDVNKQPAVSPPRTFRQDLHYSFVEMGGSAITHYSFLEEIADPIKVERLCGTLFLVADGDNAEVTAAYEAKGFHVPEGRPAIKERLESLKSRLGVDFFALQSKEVENVTSVTVLNRVVTSLEGKEVQLDVQWKDYRLSPMSEVLDKAVRARIGNCRSYSSLLRTEKAKFASLVSEHTKSYADLTPEGRELAEALYNFIAKHNPGGKSP